MRIAHKLIFSSALLAFSASFASPAAAETDADFSKYCRTMFPNSSPVKRAPGGKTAHYCNQGGTLQGIDLAKACELTTGSRAYRILGDRVLCGDESDREAVTREILIGPANFAEYCRKLFKGGVYTHRPGDARGVHHCRAAGPPSSAIELTIDPAGVCRDMIGSSTILKRGRRIYCVPAKSSQTAAKTHRPERRPAESSRPDNTGSGDKSASGPKTARGDISGVWEWTTNSLRKGLKVRFDVKGDRVTGRIEKVPGGKIATVVRDYDGLAVGSVFLVGTLQGDKLVGKTRIGIMGSSRIMNGQRCQGFVAGLEQNRNKWMAIELKRKGDTLVGRHRIVGLTFGNSGCATQRIPDTPPRIKGGYAVVEMKQAG